MLDRLLYICSFTCGLHSCMVLELPISLWNQLYSKYDNTNDKYIFSMYKQWHGAVANAVQVAILSCVVVSCVVCNVNVLLE